MYYTTVRLWHKVIFSEDLFEFSFHSPRLYAKLKLKNQSVQLFSHSCRSWRTNGWMPFRKGSEIKAASSRIWTRVTYFISFNNNCCYNLMCTWGKIWVFLLLSNLSELLLRSQRKENLQTVFICASFNRLTAALKRSKKRYWTEFRI